MLTNPDGTPFREEWGWTSYRRTGWVNTDGIRQYEAHFRSPGSPRGFSTCTILFWARHPRLALRHIVTGKKSLDEICAFHNTIIN
ncbi:MAG: hypothetical protein ACHQ7N_18160 [Candidatus Methylomirabilales bacterium]